MDPVSLGALALLCHWETSRVREAVSPDGVNLVLDNQTTHHASDPGPETCSGEVDGLPVTVVWNHTWDAPDIIVVTPPPGWTAEPSHLILEEGAQMIVKIRPMGLS